MSEIKSYSYIPEKPKKYRYELLPQGIKAIAIPSKYKKNGLIGFEVVFGAPQRGSLSDLVLRLYTGELSDIFTFERGSISGIGVDRYSRESVFVSASEDDGVLNLLHLPAEPRAARRPNGRKGQIPRSILVNNGFDADPSNLRNFGAILHTSSAQVIFDFMLNQHKPEA